MSRVCRLCLTHYENGSVLSKMTTDTYKSQIELILPEINLDIIKSPMVCVNCTKLLTSAYMFKNLCIDNEVRIQTLLNNCLVMDVTLDDLLGQSEMVKPQQDPIEFVVVNQENVSFGMVPNDVSYNSAETLNPEANSQDVQILPSQDNIKIETTEYTVITGDNTNLSQPASIPTEDAQVFKCSFCQKEMIGMKRLMWHMQIHPGRPHNCEVCNWSFDDFSELVLHKETHNPSETVIYNRCDVCGIRTLCMAKLKAHIEEHEIGRGVKRKYCETCDLQFVKDADFESHMSQHKAKESRSGGNVKVEEILPT